MLLGKILEKWAYEPVVVSDGAAAWEVLAGPDPPRLAILDWVMPGFSGIEVCQLLRSRPPYIYTIFLTAKSTCDDLVLAMEAGADDYLTKPFDQNELLLRLRAGQRMLAAMERQPAPELPKIEYSSCFISHSSKDAGFAEQLNTDLRAAGIQCWYAPEDLRIGDKFRKRIDESIYLHDKLLLILSQSSVRSAWVESEVEAAFQQERLRSELLPEALRGNTTVLFPVQIDDVNPDDKVGWGAEIRRTRHIGDFRNWKDPAKYQAGLTRLLRDLALSSERDQEAKTARKKLVARLGLRNS